MQSYGMPRKVDPVDQGSESVLSTDEAVAGVRAGLQMDVEDAVGRASAVIATRVGEAYLRTTRDRRVTDNIGELPVLDELPDVTGIGLSCQDLGLPPRLRSRRLESAQRQPGWSWSAPRM